MARPGGPRADYRPVLDDVVNHWARAGGTFERAVKVVVTPAYARCRNVSVVRVQRAVRELAREVPLQLLRQAAMTHHLVAKMSVTLPRMSMPPPIIAEYVERQRRYVERQRRLVAFANAFPDLIPEDMPISKLGRLHDEAAVLLRKRMKPVKNRAKSTHSG